MTEKFQNKYRIPSHRKPGWRYSSNGMYFITLVTQHRICNLGEIVNENSPVMVLSDFGKIVDAEWNKSFEIRNELFLESYVIMPNHLHAIVVIDNENDAVSDGAIDGTFDDAMVETHGRASLLYGRHRHDHRCHRHHPQCPNVYQNQFHHFWRDSNRRLIQKLMIILMQTI